MLASWKDTKSYRRKVLFQVLFDLFGCFPCLYYIGKKGRCVHIDFLWGRRETTMTIHQDGSQLQAHVRHGKCRSKVYIGWCFFGELKVMPCKLIGYFERFNIWMYMIVDSYICWSCMLFPIHGKKPGTNWASNFAVPNRWIGVASKRYIYIYMLFLGEYSPNSIHTFQKSDVDTKNGHILKHFRLFQTTLVGYLAVRFWGCKWMNFPLWFFSLVWWFFLRSVPHEGTNPQKARPCWLGFRRKPGLLGGGFGILDPWMHGMIYLHFHH